MDLSMTRRGALSAMGLSAVRLPSLSQERPRAPGAPVAVSKCASYGRAELLAVLNRLFDQLGGLGGLVRGKTVAIKLNFNGGPTVRLGHLPLGDTHWPHPDLICAAMHLMSKAGARRFRLVEGVHAPRTQPLEEHMLEANWDPRDFHSAAPMVEFENTNYMGAPGRFFRLPVPSKGLLFSAYDLNHSYVDCDVFVSIAKPKDHPTTGVTLVMKNLFGLPPLMAYGNGVGKYDDSDLVANSRFNMLHLGKGQPGAGALPEIDPASPREDGYRVPRVIADLVAARPVQLSIVDGVKTMAGGQTPNPSCVAVAPGFLMVGTNVVTTSAVALAAMNYDPMADRGTVPFETCDNKLRLAEELGVGTRDLRRIEVIGTPIRDVMFDFKSLRARRTAPIGRSSAKLAADEGGRTRRRL